MTFRAAVEADVPATDAFLARHGETSMFLRSNLALHGPRGGPAPHATAMWLDIESDGEIRGVYGLSTFGMILVQAPGTLAAASFRDAIAGRGIAGMTGASEQVSALAAALGLAAAPARLRSDEPLYMLALEDLRIPRGESRLVAPDPGMHDTLCHWRTEHHLAHFGTPPAEAGARAREDIAGMITSDRLRVLVGPDGAPHAKTGFNAVLPDTVQVGHVYTPPDLRNRGYARRAVALHLAEARARGVCRAILFAASLPACRAYEAIGFRRIGTYALVFFDGVQRIERGDAA